MLSNVPVHLLCCTILLALSCHAVRPGEGSWSIDVDNVSPTPEKRFRSEILFLILFVFRPTSCTVFPTPCSKARRYSSQVNPPRCRRRRTTKLALLLLCSSALQQSVQRQRRLDPDQDRVLERLPEARRQRECLNLFRTVPIGVLTYRPMSV